MADKIQNIDKKVSIVITTEEAIYLVQKLDTPSIIPINGHQDRVNMNIIYEKLMKIANEKKHE